VKTTLIETIKRVLDVDGKIIWTWNLCLRIFNDSFSFEQIELNLTEADVEGSNRGLLQGTIREFPGRNW